MLNSFLYKTTFRAGCLALEHCSPLDYKGKHTKVAACHNAAWFYDYFLFLGPTLLSHGTIIYAKAICCNIACNCEPSPNV